MILMAIIHAVDVAGVDLNLLIAFDALVKERAVTRAGQRIGLSQPAMSHALLRLRRLFDDELFVRSPRGMEPTPRARELAAAIAPALTQIQRALTPPARFDPATCEEPFVAGMAEYAQIALIEYFATAFRARAPRADLSIPPITKNDFVDKLDAGAIHVAVGYLVDLPPRLDTAPLLSDRLVCLGRKRHPALRRGLTLKEYVRLVHILVTPTAGERRGAIDRVLAQRGLSRRVALTVGTYLALPLALHGSDLVATLPERTARKLARMGDLTYRPIPLGEAAEVSMVWHRRDAADPAHAWLRALIVEAAAAS
jgi:DNA-binding transcriptional LysR family regulator